MLYDPSKKYWRATITEKNGDKEYSTYKIIQADSKEEAQEKADNMAKTWLDYEEGYEEGIETYYGNYEFFGGEIVVYSDGVYETNPIEFFERNM